MQTAWVLERWPYQDLLKVQSLLSHHQEGFIAAMFVERANRADKGKQNVLETSLAVEIAEKPGLYAAIQMVNGRNLRGEILLLPVRASVSD